jgi:hypothetical protein
VASPSEVRAFAAELIATLEDRPLGVRWFPVLAPWLGDSGVAQTGVRGAEALIGTWEHLDEGQRKSVVRLVGAVSDDALLRAVTSPDTKVRAGAAAFVCDCGDDRWLGLAVALLADPEPAVAGHAERALVNAAGTCDGDLAREEVVLPWVKRAAEGLGRHGRRGVAGAIVRLLSPRRRAGLLEHVGRGREEAGLLRGAIRSGEDALSRQRAWELLAIPDLEAGAVARLGRATSDAEHEGVLGAWHLGENPRRRAALGAWMKDHQRAMASGRRPPLWPAPARTPALSDDARRGISATLSACDAPATLREHLLVAHLSDPRPFVRHAAARIAPTPLLTDFAFDSDASVARTAALRLSLVGTGASARHGAPWSLLARSTHAGLRAIALREHAVTSWVGRLDPESRVHARRARERDAVATRDLLRRSWDAGDAQARTRIAMQLRVLGWEELCADGLIAALCEGCASGVLESRRLAATAAAAIERVADESAGDALREACMSDAGGDARIRSNALEALVGRARARRGAEHGLGSMLLECKGDAHHRVRASAIRAMLGRGERTERSLPTEGIACEALLAMLTDDSAAHRLAGIWLAERTIHSGGLLARHARRGEIVALVELAAGVEPEARIRDRASACTERIAAELSGRATHRAVVMEAAA